MINLGKKDLDSIYVSEDEIQSVYLGEEEIWNNAKFYPLGAGQSFNLRNYKGYTRFTADNIFFRTFPSFASYFTFENTGYFPIQIWAKYDYVKSITNGVLSCYGIENKFPIGNKPRHNVTPFLLTRESRAISLGTATSYNIQELLPNVDYTTLTADDFYLREPATKQDTKTVYPDNEGNVGVFGSYRKSYRNGILTSYFDFGYGERVGVEMFYIPRKLGE